MKHAEESKSLRVPAAELFQTVDELLQSGKTAVFQVSGQSMWPLICGGRDSVEVERAAPDALRKGDIVLLRTEGGDYLLHRIVRLSGDGFETAGDGNLCEDEMVFPYACLHARVARVLRPRVTVRCRGPLWRTASYLWMKSIPVRGAILRSGRRVYALLHRKGGGAA